MDHPEERNAMRKLSTPAVLMLLMNACVSGAGQPVWTVESSQLELVRRPTGFQPNGGPATQLQVKKQDLSEKALAQLQSIHTLPLDSVSCTEDASWVRMLKVVDQNGDSRTYYADDYACPKSENRLIVKGDSLDALEKLLK
jgi:hypothetical protein